MSARRTVGLGILLILLLSGALIWVRGQRQQATAVQHVAAQEVSGRVLGASSRQIAGIDHQVERYIAPPGYTTIEAQLVALGIELHPEDEFTAIPDPSFGVGSEIEIVRATSVTLSDAKQLTSYRIWLTTVGDLLASQSITLDADDRIDSTPDTPLRDALIITITRVGTKEVVETEPISFTKVTKKDAGMEKGTTKVSQQGKNGVRSKTYRITYEDGEQISKQLIQNEITQAAVEEVTLEGTKILAYGSGEATWYAWKPGGAAHNTLPRGTCVHVVSLASGKSADVTINDRGIQGSAIIDLDKASFAAIAPLGAGRINVRLEKCYP